MKNQKGFSLIVLVITIVVIIILAAITLTPGTKVIDDSANSKEQAEATLDDDKIRSIITYEVAGTTELINPEIDLMRLQLDNSTQVVYKGVSYGTGYTLYIAKQDIAKIEQKTGRSDYYKSFNDLTKSYIVDNNSGTFTRLVEDWSF